MEKIHIDSIFSIRNGQEFEQMALEIFQFQVRKCQIYADFVKYLNLDSAQISNVKEIPFLPIEFFKNHSIVSKHVEPELVFSSSGTTGLAQSKHLVTDLWVYEKSFRDSFELAYGKIQDFATIALLPSYLEREGSSLIYMVDAFIRESKYKQSGYFLYNHAELYQTLKDLKKHQIPTLLIGVTYALLDLVEKYTLEFPELIVMETGGMKGKRKEIVREELHQTLCEGFGVKTIHSEYGMTELLSQAYAKELGLFHCPPWMHVYIRDTNDPFNVLAEGQTGGINVVDLANMYSCSFIATQDLGKAHIDGSFEVLGRFDNSDIRGCNLLVQQ